MKEQMLRERKSKDKRNDKNERRKKDISDTRISEIKNRTWYVYSSGKAKQKQKLKFAF